MPVTTLKDALEFYRNYAQAIENRADDTIRFKETPVRQFIKYLGYDPLLEEINERMMVDFFGSLRQHEKWDNHPSGNKPQGKLADTAGNSYFRGLRALFNWLVKHDIIVKSPLTNLEEPEYVEKLPRHLKFDEVQRILKAINRKTYIDFRDATIIVLSSDIGLQASELVGLGLGDVDIQAGDLKPGNV